MNRRFLFPAFATLVALPFAASNTRAAGAADKRACVAAYESGQHLRIQKKLRKAREQFAICAESKCPQVVAPDCNAWLKEADASIPTMAFRVRDERSRNLTDYKVTIDGEALPRELESTASPFDPGSHVVRIEADGFVAFEQKVTLAAGEKGFVVEANLLPLVRELPPVEPVREPIREPIRDLPKLEPRPADKGPEIRLPEEPRADTSPSKIGPAIYIAGGVSFLAFTSFTFLGLQGMREADELRRTCAPDCAKGNVDAARTKLVAANVSLGVGIGTAALTGILFALQPSSTSHGVGRTRLVAIDVRPATHGRGAEVMTTFSAP